MAANYFALPKPVMPSNAMIDFEPVNNALETMRQQRNFATQRGDMLEQRDYQRGRDAKQDARVAKADTREDAKWFGSQALAIDKMQGPQRAAAWQAIIAKHPDKSSLTPDYLDQMKGPAMVAAEAGQFNDPLERQLKQAQINKLNQQIANGGSEYGKAGTIVQDPKTGSFYSVQYGARGEPKVSPLQIGGTALQPAKGVDQVGDVLVDKATGGTVRSVAPNLQNAESVKAFGKEQGEARAKAGGDLPRVRDNATLALKTIDQIMMHPGKQWGVGAAGIVPGIPGTQQRGFVNLVEQLKGKTFLEAFNSLRGGGQITEAEGSKATQALARLDRAQRPEDFDAALSDLREVITLGVRRAQMSAGAAGILNSQQSNDGWTEIDGVRIREKR